MIKAVAGELLMFGLSDENIKRLRDNHPIYFDLKELGLSGKVVIFWGPTEDEMKKALVSMLAPDAEVVDRRPKMN